VTTAAWITLFSPAAAVVVLALAGTRVSRRAAGLVATTSVLVSFIASVVAFVELLGLQIVEQMNLAVVPHATSVAACALLGERRRGLFRADLALRMQQLVDLLRIMNVKLTPALVRDEGDFSDSIASLLRMDLIRAAPDQWHLLQPNWPSDRS